MVIEKGKDASAELIGHIFSGTTFKVSKGATVLAPDSFVQTSPKYGIKIAGTLVLTDGAYFGEYCNKASGTSIAVEAKGKVLAGTGKRPLKRNCLLGVSRKSGEIGPKTGWGLKAGKGAVVVTTADGSDAKLLVTWHGMTKAEMGKKKRKTPAPPAALHDGIRVSLPKTDGVEVKCAMAAGKE
jgi:hypothetical protein